MEPNSRSQEKISGGQGGGRTFTFTVSYEPTAPFTAQLEYGGCDRTWHPPSRFTKPSCQAGMLTVSCSFSATVIAVH